MTSMKMVTVTGVETRKKRGFALLLSGPVGMGGGRGGAVYQEYTNVLDLDQADKLALEFWVFWGGGGAVYQEYTNVLDLDQADKLALEFWVFSDRSSHCQFFIFIFLKSSSSNFIYSLHQSAKHFMLSSV